MRSRANFSWSFTTSATLPPVTCCQPRRRSRPALFEAGRVESVGRRQHVLRGQLHDVRNADLGLVPAPSRRRTKCRRSRSSYRGRNSQSSCTQTVDIWRWSDSTWVQLDTRTVGTTEMSITSLVPPGVLADYVNGTSGNGDVRIRVRATRSANFTSRGECDVDRLQPSGEPAALGWAGWCGGGTDTRHLGGPSARRGDLF